MTTAQKIIKYCALALAIFLIVSILTGIVGAVTAIAGLLNGESLAGEYKTYTLEQNFEKLYIDISAGELEIQSGEQFSLESNHRYLKVIQKNGKLEIRDTRKAIHNVDAKDVKISLTIPEEFWFSNVRISTGAGVVSVERMDTNFLDMDLGAGEVTIGMLNVYKEADIETGAGRFTVEKGLIRGLDLDMGMGEASLAGKLEGDCQIDLGVGKTKLTLSGSLEDYRITLEKGLGEAKLEGKNIENGTYGSGDVDMEIQGGIGSLEIEFS